MERFRVAVFVLVLAALFAGAAIAGRLADVAPRSAGEAGGGAPHGEAATAAVASVDGYTVTLRRDSREAGAVTFTSAFTVEAGS